MRDSIFSSYTTVPGEPINFDIQGLFDNHFTKFPLHKCIHLGYDKYIVFYF